VILIVTSDRVDGHPDSYCIFARNFIRRKKGKKRIAKQLSMMNILQEKIFKIMKCQGLMKRKRNEEKRKL
jgi:hypothetical protein